MARRRGQRAAVPQSLGRAADACRAEGEAAQFNAASRAACSPALGSRACDDAVALEVLRSQFVFPTVVGAIVDANSRGRGRFQIVHYSVQADHLHLLVEAFDRQSLIEGMRGFSVSLTPRINRLLFRKGRLVADRWHGRALGSPRAVRRALVYVLANAKKHGERVGAVDPLSSAPHFRGFREFAPRSPAELEAKLVPRLCSRHFATGSGHVAARQGVAQARSAFDSRHAARAQRLMGAHARAWAEAQPSKSSGEGIRSVGGSIPCLACFTMSFRRSSAVSITASLGPNEKRA